MPPSRHPNDLAELVRRGLQRASVETSLSGGGAVITPGAGEPVDNLDVLHRTDFNTKGDLLAATADDAYSVLPVGQGYLTATPGDPHGMAWVREEGVLEIVIDGAQAPPLTGVKLDIPINFAGVWTAWTLLADVNGSIQLDLWKDVYANFPPTVADSIVAAAKPKLISASKAQDSTLTGWTTAFAAGDILRVNIDSVTTITRVTLGLNWRRA